MSRKTPTLPSPLGQSNQAGPSSAPPPQPTQQDQELLYDTSQYLNNDDGNLYDILGHIDYLGMPCPPPEERPPLPEVPAAERVVQCQKNLAFDENTPENTQQNTQQDTQRESLLSPNAFHNLAKDAMKSPEPMETDKPKKDMKRSSGKGKATTTSQPAPKHPYARPPVSGQSEGHGRPPLPKPSRVMHIAGKNILSEKRYTEVDPQLRILNDTVLKREQAYLKQEISSRSLL